MKPIVRTTIVALVALALAGLLSACAPAPLYKVAPDTPAISPAQVANTPEQYQGRTVVWAGTVVQVTNYDDHSEIEVLSYPLDSSQRPVIGRNNSQGRFIAVLPGFVEPLNFPPGAPITVLGTLDGTHTGKVGEAPYVFARVKVRQHHVWTASEMRSGHSHVSFGMGIGVGSGGRSGVGVGVGVQ